MNDKNIIFSKEIDDSINGIALGITFSLMAFLLMSLKIIPIEILNHLIAILMIIIGICGTFIELEKLLKGKIKGVQNFSFGFVFSFLLYFGITKIDYFIIDLLFFVMLLILVYITFQGALCIIYSIILERRKLKSKKIKTVNTIVFVTELIVLITAVVEFFNSI